MPDHGLLIAFFLGSVCYFTFEFLAVIVRFKAAKVGFQLEEATIDAK
jgi:hypothetical protein